jgi:phosphatidylglycerophosphate synthase
VRAVLICDARDGIIDWAGLLGIRIAGRSLLERHLLAFRSAGFHEILIRTATSQKDLESLVARVTPEGMKVHFAASDCKDATLEVQADLLVDPRLIRDLVATYSERACEVICTDVYDGNYRSEAKSPYVVGAAGPGELEKAEQKHRPIGVSIHPAAGEIQPDRVQAAVGRYYWHMVAGRADIPEATRKIFLSTMKATDGIYARTNRRVSIPISRILVQTPITPNMVTLIALCCSLAAAWLYSLGTYSTMVAGSIASWFASMMDGCDGEVARVKLQESEFGAWFEMVCDYLYYVVMFLGMGVGIARYTENPAWNWVGIGSAFGTIVSFVVIGRLRKRHAREAPSADFGRVFQAKVGARTSNPLHFFSRHVGFLITRAAMPYYIVLFTVLNIAPWIMGMILAGTNLAWFLALCAYPLFRPPVPSQD